MSQSFVPSPKIHLAPKNPRGKSCSQLGAARFHHPPPPQTKIPVNTIHMLDMAMHCILLLLDSWKKCIHKIPFWNISLWQSVIWNVQRNASLTKFPLQKATDEAHSQPSSQRTRGSMPLEESKNRSFKGAMQNDYIRSFSNLRSCYIVNIMESRSVSIHIIYIHTLKPIITKNVWFFYSCQKMISCPLKQSMATSLLIQWVLNWILFHKKDEQNTTTNGTSIKLTQLQTPCPSRSIYFSLSQSESHFHQIWVKLAYNTTLKMTHVYPVSSQGTPNSTNKNEENGSPSLN